MCSYIFRYFKIFIYVMHICMCAYYLPDLIDFVLLVFVAIITFVSFDVVTLIAIHPVSWSLLRT